MKKIREILFNLFIFGIIVFTFYLIYQVFHMYFSAFHGKMPSSKAVEEARANWGVFGDYFGGVVNPLLGFISFIAVLYTIQMQNKQLKSNDKTQAIQIFEGLFTSMTSELSNIYKELVEDLEDKTELDYLSHKGQKLFINSKKLLSSQPFVFNKKHISKSLRIEYSLVRYFMYLYQVLKLIDSQNEMYFSFKRKKVYTNIVRASIEGNILQLLFLNTVFVDDDDFKPYNELVVKYGFFEHMNFKIDDEISPTLTFIAGLYASQAFDKSVYYRRIINDLLNYYRVTSPNDFYKCKLDNGIFNNSIIIYDHYAKCFKLSNTEILIEEPIEFFITEFISAKTAYSEQSHGISFKEIRFEIPSKNLSNCMINLYFTSKRTLKIVIRYQEKNYTFHKQHSNFKLIMRAS